MRMRGEAAEVDSSMTMALAGLLALMLVGVAAWRWAQTAQTAARAQQALLESQAQAQQAREEVAQLRGRLSALPQMTQQLERADGMQAQLQKDLQAARVAQASAQTAAQSSAQRVQQLEQESTTLRQKMLSLQASEADLRVALEGAHQQLTLQAAASQEKLQLLLQAREEMSAQFKALASEVLGQNAKQIHDQSQQGLQALLDPLRQRLQDFQKKVEDVYVDESKERSALKQQVAQLVELNQVLSTEARNLTTALKGSVKAQGNWGELVLERVLEASGLRRGEEFLVQDAQRNEDGARQLPDVVIRLPEGRRLVVDSKVSLLGYDRFVNASDDAKRAVGLREHLASVRAHLKGLSDKKYQGLYGQSLDFVLMFVPVEPAFSAAVTHDQHLFMEAWSKNVLLVSPSTLLFVVRTVAHLWRQEAQSKNAQDIAKRGAELYDKLHGFVQDFEMVGTRMGLAQDAFGQAKKKLVEGRGNVIRQAEQLRALGVKPTKALPSTLVDQAHLGAEREALEQAGALAALPPAPGELPERLPAGAA